ICLVSIACELANDSFGIRVDGSSRQGHVVETVNMPLDFRQVARRGQSASDPPRTPGRPRCAGARDAAGKKKTAAAIGGVRPAAVRLRRFRVRLKNYLREFYSAGKTHL